MIRTLTGILFFCFSLNLLAQKTTPWPYQNPALAVPERVADLLSRMTLEEKLWQLFMTPGDWTPDQPYRHGLFGLQIGTLGRSSDAAAQLLQRTPAGTARAAAEHINQAQRYFVEETRLGIPIIPFDEALHGLVREGATAFPQAIGLAATWNTELMGRVAAAIARETRSRGIRQILSPVVNVATDVRWGRVEETYGEDPLLASAMGVAFVREFEKIGVITTPKHFLANHGDGGRDSYPVEFNARRLAEVYLPPFKACFELGGARSVMTSYNSLDGLPCTANDRLLLQLLTRRWDFRGFVISDAGATGGINDLHRCSAGYAASARLAIENGLDVLFQTSADHFPLFFAPALNDQPIDTAAVHRALRRVLTAKFDLGLFEDPYVDAQEAAFWNGHPAHREAALQAARESIVLLKNSGDLLPLGQNIRSLALIGPDADTLRLGGYSGPGNTPLSILQGLVEVSAGRLRIEQARGCARERVDAVIVAASCLTHTAAGKTSPGLEGLYWDNPDFAGAPALQRTDARVDYDWNLFSPHPSIPFDSYSMRWTGQITAAATGVHRLGLEGNDGFRLYLDDSLLIDNWRKTSYRRTLVSRPFLKGVPRKLKIEYHERSGGGSLKLLWNCGVVDRDDRWIEAAVRAARRCDVAVVVAGLVEGEGMDRATLHLPGRQEELIRAVAATGTPTVVLIVGGSAVTMNAWIDRVAAIAAVWYPGEMGGRAVAEVLCGEYNPAGRLPITFPLREGQVPLTYNHKPTGRLDRYHDAPGEPLFPFGHGLSYTTFDYQDLRLDQPAIGRGDTLQISCRIRNSGARAGDEVVQLYSRDLVSSVAQPLMALKAFQRLHLQPGESRIVHFTLPSEAFAILDKEMNAILEPGEVRLFIGGSSRDIRLRTSLNLQ